jgi:hypothetical protein
MPKDKMVTEIRMNAAIASCLIIGFVLCSIYMNDILQIYKFQALAKALKLRS